MGPVEVRVGAGDARWRGYRLTEVHADRWSAVVVGEVAEGDEATHGAATIAELAAGVTGPAALDRPGHWSVVAVSPEGAVHVLTDRFGTVHVGIGRGERVAVGTEMAAVEDAAGLPAGAEGLDWESLAGWCALGFHVGVRTHRVGLTLARPSTHTVVAPDGALAEHVRWRWEPRPDAGRTEADLVAEVDDLLARVLDPHLAEGPLALPISGGLDSRTTVAVLTRPGAPAGSLWAYTYGYGALSPETAVARAVGRTRGLDVAVRPVPRYLLADLDRAAAAVEGAQDLTQTRQLGVIDEVAAHAERVVAAHWGDVWFDRAGPPTAGALTREGLRDAALAKWAKPADWLLHHVVAPHLDRPVEEVVRGLVEAAAEPYVGVGGDEGADWALKALKTDQWSFRWTVASLRAHHAGATPVLPFYDGRVADWFLTVPPGVQAGRALQVALLRRRHPDLARVPWEVTGRPLAGPAPTGWRIAATARRAGRGVRRVLRRPQEIRGWEVQLRGPSAGERLDEVVLGSPIGPLLDAHAWRALRDEVARPGAPPSVGYPVAMLLTLAAELRRRS